MRINNSNEQSIMLYKSVIFERQHVHVNSYCKYICQNTGQEIFFCNEFSDGIKLSKTFQIQNPSMELFETEIRSSE